MEFQATLGVESSNFILGVSATKEECPRNQEEKWE